MHKLILLHILLFALSVSAQNKQHWTVSGFGEYKGTTTKTFTLSGKDSLTYTIQTQNCNCDFYTTIGDHKLHPCKGLRLHTVEVHFMDYSKDVTYVKGIKISETKPKWDSNISQVSNIEGIYEQNGKMVYIHSIHLLNHKLINTTQPYKFTSEWLVLNEY